MSLASKLLALFIALACGAPAFAQVSLQTPVTTMAPNKRVYVNGIWPKKDFRNLGRSTSVIDEVTGRYTPAQGDLGDPGGTTPGRWPGYTLGQPGYNASGFRIFIYESHYGFDDPIVYPGQPGMSHAHLFFGNTNTRGTTTAVSLATTGNSTSAGGTANRSGYWVPAIVWNCDSTAKVADGCPWQLHGQVVRPNALNGLNAYYKGHFGEELDNAPGRPAGFWVFNHVTESLPVNFRMIAGLPTATPDSPATGQDDLGNSFTCLYYPGQVEVPYKWIPGTGGTTPCPAGTAEIKMVIRFPSCHNGDLDSPNHKSHVVGPSTTSSADYTMLHSEDWYCPNSHPYMIPGVTFKVHFDYPGDSLVKFWRLSSDNYDTTRPAGYSIHGDWFNGWDQSVMDEWVTQCTNRGVDCHDNVIGPGVLNTSKWRVLRAPLGVLQ